MHYPQIYIGCIPGSTQQRRALRARALDLHARLRTLREPTPSFALISFSAGDAPADQIDLLLARPNVLIVGALREYQGPIVARPGAWFEQPNGAPLLEPGGRTPLAHIAAQRDAVRALLGAAPTLANSAAQRALARMLGALICVPSLHAESQITLDIDDHRQGLKVLGLDELPGLASMASSGARLGEGVLQEIVGSALGGRLWHNGERLLFELAPSRFQIRLLGPDESPKKALPLLEGSNIIGRRRAAQAHEHRLVLGRDDLVSSDHAEIVCWEDGAVTIRDTSKNGTWVTPPGSAEIYLHGASRAIPVGSLLRMGVTKMRLEPHDADPGPAHTEAE